MILGHVLASEHGVVVLLSTRLSCSQTYVRETQEEVALDEYRCTQDSPQLLASPLGLVCHELRRQTRNLIFQANDRVTLYGASFVTPSSYTLTVFARQIGAAALKGLRMIDVHGSPSLLGGFEVKRVTWEDMTIYLSDFQSFCSENDHIQVVIRSPVSQVSCNPTGQL